MESATSQPVRDRVGSDMSVGGQQTDAPPDPCRSGPRAARSYGPCRAVHRRWERALAGSHPAVNLVPLGVSDGMEPEIEVGANTGFAADAATVERQRVGGDALTPFVSLSSGCVP